MAIIMDILDKLRNESQREPHEPIWIEIINEIKRLRNNGRWYGEFNLKRPNESDKWERISDKPRRTKEHAKAECKRMLEEHPHVAEYLQFRIIFHHSSVIQESKPPYDKRMLWFDVSR